MADTGWANWSPAPGTDAWQCKFAIPDSSSDSYQDFIQKYQCWLYDDSIPAPIPDIPSAAGEQASALPYSQVVHDTSPQGSSSTMVAPSKTAITGLQKAINRFFGSATGSLIVEDGDAGPNTLNALNTVIAWLPGAGYDPSDIVVLVGTSPTVSSIAGHAAAVSNVLDVVADNFGYAAGTSSNPPSVALVQGPRGKTLATIPPKGSSQAAAAGILGLGLPNWMVYAGGAVLVIGIGYLVYKRKKPELKSIEGARNTNAYGLTFYRWWRAAGFSSERKVPTKAYDAWARGEDPSDWRAEQQRT
jgi:hypothetical protein